MPDDTLLDPLPEGGDPLVRIVFGSCNDQRASQAYWGDMAGYFGAEGGVGYPDAWVWGGDIVYADTEHAGELRQAYAAVQHGPYRRFAQDCRDADCIIVGTWDDHDFGDNNLGGGVNNDPSSPDSPFHRLNKTQRKAALLEFLGEPTRSHVADQKPVYARYDFDRPELRVRLLLLDLRFDRELPGMDASIISPAQWSWLERELMDTSIDLHIIVSSTQVLRQDTRKDTWAEYPEQRRKLLDLLGKSPARGIVLLSGDIHAAEISRLGESEERAHGLRFPLYEITSSGLNRLRCMFGVCWYRWRNSYQEGFKVAHNFAEIDVMSNDGSIAVVGTLRSPLSPTSTPLLRKTIYFPDPAVTQ